MTTLYGLYADSWRITDEESLFDYEGTDSTATFTDMGFPTSIVRVADLTAEQRDTAAAICQSAGVTDPILLDACILDVALTADAGFADGALASPVPVAANEGYYFAAFGDGSVGAEWSPAVSELSEVGGEWFLGSFGNDSVSLSLTGLPTHTQATITADLYVFGPWDGNSTTAGPDRVNVFVDGQILSDVTFSNDPGVSQSFPDDYPGSHPGQTGAIDIDTLDAVSAVYRLSYTVDHWGEDLVLDVAATNLTDFGEQPELWGLDNVSVDVDLVQPDLFEATIGTPMSGAIEVARAEDIYTLEVTVPTSLLFVNQQWLSGGQWTLTAPSEADVFDGSMTSRIAELTETGTYQLTITADGGSTGDYAFEIFPVPEPETFNIAVDQQITTDSPAGAGSIEVPGSRDVYYFTAAATQEAFFDVSCFSGQWWRLEDTTGGELFDSYCFDRTAELAAGTDYVLTVSSQDDFTGDYGFRIWSVPDPQVFNVAIDAAVADGVPAAGAGRLETPGAEDIYEFEVTDSTHLVADVTDCFAGFLWILKDSSESIVTYGGCADLDTQLGPDTYRLHVVSGGSGSGYGTYAFNLIPDPPELSLALPLGERVGLGGVVPGAGSIAVPGEIHMFTFTAGPDEAMVFDSDLCAADLTWRLDGPNGYVFSASMCSDREVTLDEEGTYTLTIGGDGHHTGSYLFTVWPTLTADTFATAIGAVITRDDPGPGAGSIETPGASDEYTLSATAGDRVIVHVLDGDSSLKWSLLDSSQTTVSSGSLYTYGSPTLVTIPQSDTYTLKVSATGDASGDYALELLAGSPGDDFSIAVGASVSPGVPEQGAGTTSIVSGPDRYAFSATDSDEILFIHDTCNSDVDFKLVGPTGLVKWLDDCDDELVTIAGTGTHTVEASARVLTDEEYAFTLQPGATPVDDEFELTIGETISDGTPPGAGNLETYNSTDVYQFAANEGDTVLFMGTGSSVNWLLTKTGTTTSLFNSGLGTKLVTFAESADYTLTVTGTSLSPATYSFSTQTVVASQEDFVIAVGATVTDGAPESGAGNIEQPGASDSYTFEADANVPISIVKEGGYCFYWFDLALFDQDGVEVPLLIDSCRGASFETDAGGTYRLVVSSSSGYATGTYEFTLLSGVGTQQFTASIDSVITPGSPDTGAGVIEGPYDADEYLIDTVAGHGIVITAHDCFDGFTWTLRDSDGDYAAGSSSCDQPKYAEVTGGQYTLRVTGDMYSSPIPTGTYQVTIESIDPPDIFPVAIGDVIAEDTPEVGAGIITQRYSRDAYSFGYEDDEPVVVVFDQCFDGLRWDITSGSVPANPSDYGGYPCGARTVTVSNTTNTLTVWASTDTVGSYQVHLEHPGATEHFAIAVGDTVTAGSAGAGSGNIEALGGSDRYTFVAPDSGYVSLTTPVCPSGFTWQIVLEDTSYPDTTDPCQSHPMAVTPGDTYTIIITSNTDPGGYQFTLRNGPVPQLFEVTIGTTVSDGVPAAGAGNIEERGSIDLYDITDGGAYVQLTNCSSQDLYLQWNPDDGFPVTANCDDPPTWLPSHETLEIKGQDGSTSTYQLDVME